MSGGAGYAAAAVDVGGVAGGGRGAPQLLPGPGWRRPIGRAGSLSPPC